MSYVSAWSGRYLQKCRNRCAVSALVGIRRPNWRSGQRKRYALLSYSCGCKTRNPWTFTSRLYGTNVIPVEQMRKWWRECRGRGQKWPSTSNPTHSTALLAPPRDFKVWKTEVKKKIVSEAGIFHATMPSKPRLRSDFENVSSYGQGFWKSCRAVWQVSEYVWWLCGKMKDWCPNDKLIKLIKRTMQRTKMKVKVNNRYCEWFETKTRVRQRDPLSALLLSVVLASVITNL